MAWWIERGDSSCGSTTRVANIVDLLDENRDGLWFVCRKCGGRGYIEKRYGLQEGGDWTPFLLGAMRLGHHDDDTYQPFAFLIAEAPDADVNAVQFSYYKDLRAEHGRLKTGLGPGGPPVISIDSLQSFMETLARIGD